MLCWLGRRNVYTFLLSFSVWVVLMTTHEKETRQRRRTSAGFGPYSSRWSIHSIGRDAAARHLGSISIFSHARRQQQQHHQQPRHGNISTTTPPASTLYVAACRISTLSDHRPSQEFDLSPLHWPQSSRLGTRQDVGYPLHWYAGFDEVALCLGFLLITLQLDMTTLSGKLICQPDESAGHRWRKLKPRFAPKFVVPISHYEITSCTGDCSVRLEALSVYFGMMDRFPLAASYHATDHHSLTDGIVATRDGPKSCRVVSPAQKMRTST